MLPVMRRDSWLPEVFNDFFNGDFAPRTYTTAPAINVLEGENNYTVEIAAPGLKKEDFDVNIDNDGNLHIRMEQKHDEKKEDKKMHYLRREFSYSKYEQTLILPDDVDKNNISAKVEHGVMTVALPKIKKEEQRVQRRIEID